MPNEGIQRIPPSGGTEGIAGDTQPAGAADWASEKVQGTGNGFWDAVLAGWRKVSTTNPLPVAAAAVSKGQRQATSTASVQTLAAAIPGAPGAGVPAGIPTGATKVLLMTSADVWWRDDGTPAVGGPTSSRFRADERFNYDMDLLASLKVVGVATIDCVFYS